MPALASDPTDDVIWWPSPNFGPRRSGFAAPDMIVLHYTAMRSAEGARDWLCDPASEVSAHYVIAEDGRIWRLVREEDRAWHAGAGSWAGQPDVNSASIGIELANDAAHPFPAPQMARLERLMQEMMTRWAIPPSRVVGHSDTALGRKVDPGVRFDWQRLARQGLSIWPEARAGGTFWDSCRTFGYDVRPDTQETVLAAFRMRFRPWSTGPLDEVDRALAADLAARWPAAPLTGA